MVSIAERAFAPVHIIPTQVKPGAEPIRLFHEDSLNGPGIQRDITPQVVIPRIAIAGEIYRGVLVYSGYSDILHLMFVPWRENGPQRYIPGPAWVSPEEGEGVIHMMADVAEEMLLDTNTASVTGGWNNSELSAQKGNFQSWPALWHPGVYALSRRPPKGQNGDYIRYILLHKNSDDDDILTADERRTYLGDMYKRQVATLIRDYLLGDKFEGDRQTLRALFDLDRAEISRHGLQVPFQGDFLATLRSPGVFRDVLQPLNVMLVDLAMKMSRVYTDFDPERRYRIIEEIVTNPSPSQQELDAAIASVQTIPSLRSFQEREYNIEVLRQEGIPDNFIRFLHLVNHHLPEKGETTWLKTGFANAIAMRYDKQTGEGSLFVTIGVRSNGPGGYFEAAERALLRRPLNTEFSEEEMERKMALSQRVDRRVNSNRQWR